VPSGLVVITLPMSPKITRQDEEKLLQEARAGHKGAFRELVVRHERLVFALAYRMVGHAEEARDLAQEVFLKAYRALPGFRGEASIATWLRRITINLCLNHCASARHRAAKAGRSIEEQSPDGLSLGVRLADPAPNPEEETLLAERIELLQAALEELAPEQRAIVVLRDVEGHSYGEIAAVLGLNEGTVKSRLSRSRADLRTILIEKGYFN
jgi:RNA polymerase sigma-70 factor, ECF subfamily